MEIIVAIILAIFLLYAIKKGYIEMSVFLVACLIIDGIIIDAVAIKSLIGTSVVLARVPILLVLIFAMIKLISMSIFYHTLKKYNNIIGLIVYLVINLISNIFYATISGNILVDLVFNLIIGSIIIMAYKENLEMEDIKWFITMGIIIDITTILLIVNLGQPILGIAWIFFYLLFKPLIICIVPGLIVSAIVILLIRKILSKRSETVKIAICTIIIIFCECISMTAGKIFIVYEINKHHIERQEINRFIDKNNEEEKYKERY